MAHLYIESFNNKFNLESLITLYVYQSCNNKNVLLYILPVDNNVNDKFVFQIAVCTIKHTLIDVTDLPDVAKSCIWPVVLIDNKIVAGLAATARQLISLSDQSPIKSLLGFRQACLMAPSETSIWTRFCEIDIIHTVYEFLNNTSYTDSHQKSLPKTLTRFEYHMGQPVRIHNVYKEARLKQGDKLIKSSVPIKELHLKHTFGEGPFMTLADLLLYPCYKIIIEIIGEKIVENALPLTWCWYNEVEKEIIAHIDFKLPEISCSLNLDVVQDEVENYSLYVCDPVREKPRQRLYTKQIAVDRCLEKLNKADVIINNEIEPFGIEIDFEWSDIPKDASPLNGALPESRAGRKSQQLQNLAKAVIKILNETKNRTAKIVDFCSGGGHLGILLATILPHCRIFLVENKEKSLEFAYKRIMKLKLSNVTLLQCNLDYFCADFDIGVSLHACGVATDLVIQVCIKNKAHFVCCPCCYGGIGNCHQIQYPRSDIFSEILLYKDYLTLGHTADQTHDSENVKTLQGYNCMNLIDCDRKIQAEKCGYKVHLGKLQPTTCTPKNNLLVGIKCN